MLKVGDVAPAIDAVTHMGDRLVLSQLRGLCTIIYFFPKAFTPDCTREAKTFRDNYVELQMVGANLIGISTDKVATQCDFARSTQVPFPMIADPSGAICRAYDVLYPIIGLAQRITYVVNGAQRIEAAFRHQFDAKAHRDDVLRFVNTKFQSLRPR
jgi:thioredoxin-dependent peroxiredoxin